jgi:hypothetical protein
MVNPLEGVEIIGPTINPLWDQNQKYEIVCYLSTTARFKDMYFFYISYFL